MPIKAAQLSRVALMLALAKTISGKIRRSELRDQLRAGDYD